MLFLLLCFTRLEKSLIAFQQFTKTQRIDVGLNLLSAIYEHVRFTGNRESCNTRPDVNRPCMLISFAYC